MFLADIELMQKNDELYEFFIPAVSSEDVNGVMDSIFTWTQDSQAPSGAPLNVMLGRTAYRRKPCTTSGCIR